MQPNDSTSVPRRALDVEDYIDILRRHKGWIFGPFLLTLVASVVGVYLWPDTYQSVALIKIVPQQVPQNMVQSTITQDMSDRIASMATTVLSRNVLTTIINNLDLYKTEPLKVTAGPHRVSVAFVRRADGPYEDLIKPHDWSFASGGTALDTSDRTNAETGTDLEAGEGFRCEDDSCWKAFRISRGETP
jgi:hypothetical protein